MTPNREVLLRQGERPRHYRPVLGPMPDPTGPECTCKYEPHPSKPYSYTVFDDPACPAHGREDWCEDCDRPEVRCVCELDDDFDRCCPMCGADPCDCFDPQEGP